MNGEKAVVSESRATLSGRMECFREIVGQACFTGRQGLVLETEQGIRRGLALLGAAAKVYVIGNGGTAAVASHIVNDLVNNGGLKAQVLHDAALLTCMSNDYGYEHAYARILETHAGEGDLLIAISSSGQSANIRNAARVMTEKNCPVLSLTGFQATNPLRGMGDLNIWLDSSDYGFVEIGHLFLLHHLSDRFHGEGAF